MSARTILKHLHQQGRMTDYQFDVINRNLRERPQGEWKIVENQGWFSDIYICSCCGNTLDFRGVNGGRGSGNFCPNCGTKMTKEAENETN